MSLKSLVSIIPCKDIDAYTRECIEYCKLLAYENFEILLLPDYPNEVIDGVNVIATGPVSPGFKRNIGVKTQMVNTALSLIMTLIPEAIG